MLRYQMALVLESGWFEKVLWQRVSHLLLKYTKIRLWNRINGGLCEWVTNHNIVTNGDVSSVVANAAVVAMVTSGSWVESCGQTHGRRDRRDQPYVRYFHALLQRARSDWNDFNTFPRGGMTRHVITWSIDSEVQRLRENVQNAHRDCWNLTPVLCLQNFDLNVLL
jgi:hypothetical protein